MTLFEECILALDGHAFKMNVEKTQELFIEMNTKFPMTQWGRIEWNITSNKLVGIEERDILIKLAEVCLDVNNEVYILWDNANLPAIKSDLAKVLDVIDDIVSVSFDTWIFCPESNYVIEFYHEDVGKVSIGWMYSLMLK